MVGGGSVDRRAGGCVAIDGETLAEKPNEIATMPKRLVKMMIENRMEP